MIAHGMAFGTLLMLWCIFTGDKAALKFKNLRDRWVKIASAHAAKQKSGAPGTAGEVDTKWPLFRVVDSVESNAILREKVNGYQPILIIRAKRQ